MWLTKKQIEILIPADDKWHNLKMTNIAVFVDGNLVTSRLEAAGQSFMMKDRVLTENEIQLLRKPFATT